MYSVIICPDCYFPQLVKDDPKTTTCGRCQSRLKFRKLKKFYQDADIKRAQHALAEVKAKHSEKEEEFDEVGWISDSEVDEMSKAIDERVSEEFGVPSDGFGDTQNEVSRSRSRKEIVLDGIRECDPATEASVVEYAVEYGVPEAKAERLLEKLYVHGQVMRTGGGYRVP